MLTIIYYHCCPNVNLKCLLGDNQGYSEFRLTLNEGAGDVNIEVKDGAITTTGNHAHGVVGNQLGMGTTGSIDILVNGGTILASGMHASGVQVGRSIYSETNAVGVGDDGYRRQSVTVNGRVFGGTGEGAGVFLAGGGKVIIGSNGSVGAESGVAIRAAREDATDTAPSCTSP